MKEETKALLTNYFLSQRKVNTKEYGAFLVEDDLAYENNYYSLWIIKEDEKDIFERTISPDNLPSHILTNEELDDSVTIKLTFVNPGYIQNVVNGNKEISFWQMGTVIRVIKLAKIVFDPKGLLERAKKEIKDIHWSPSLIESKREVTVNLLHKATKNFENEYLADSIFWVLKAAEEALCVPLMEQNAFHITTPRSILQILRSTDVELYRFYRRLLGIPYFTVEQLKKARDELETLAQRIFKTNTKKKREMWILVAFVSLNSCEKYLDSLIKVPEEHKKFVILLENAVTELWQAYFLIAQTPWNKMAPLDQWIIASFWNSFFEWRENFYWNKKTLNELTSKIKSIINI